MARGLGRNVIYCTILYWATGPKTIFTRMHSSRMRTARSSSRLRGGGVCISACWDTPPGLGLETPHGQTPQPPPGCESGDPPPPPGQTPQLPPPPGVGLETPPAARPLNLPLGVGLDTHPPPPPPQWTEFWTHASENITLPQLRCGR